MCVWVPVCASVCVCLMFSLRSWARCVFTVSVAVFVVSAVVVAVAMSLGAYLHVLLYLLLV